MVQRRLLRDTYRGDLPRRRSSSRISLRTLLAGLATLAIALNPPTVFSQQRAIPRIGVVWGGSDTTSKASADAFFAGLRDHGYEPGRNVIVDTRFADGQPSRYARLIEELLALRPDLLGGMSTGIAVEMKKRTSTIPIVTGTTSDPVASGLARSLSRPGGNVTGMAVQLHELSAKHLEVMLELLPGARRFGVLSDLRNEKAITERYEAIAVSTARSKGLIVNLYRTSNREDVEKLFRKLKPGEIDALLINPSPRLNAMRREIIEATVRLHVPSVGFTDVYAEDGGLVSYGPDFEDAVRRSAYFVHRILQGAKPAELPIEQPTRFQLVVNAKTAATLGIRIPRSILLRANRVIE